MSFVNELSVARDAVSAAAEIARRMQPGIAVDTKDDQSPVTNADRECERAITAMLRQHFPDDGILGEEGALVESRSGRRWIIDPIDGTRDFIRGNALWANLLALEDHGEVVAGIANLPIFGRTYWASRGGGAFCNGDPIQISGKRTIGESVLCVNGYDKILHTPFHAGLLEWMSHFWAVRGLGGCADALMVSSGQAEVWIEPTAKAWDFAPLKIIAIEAGAEFFALDGSDSIYAGSGIVTVPALRKEVEKFVRQL